MKSLSVYRYSEPPATVHAGALEEVARREFLAEEVVRTLREFAIAYRELPCLDLIVQRIVDVVMAFPLIILALAVVATLGPGIENVMIAIILPFVPQCARVVRSDALAIREIPYVDAARALGFSNARIILRHMVPNVMAPYLIMLTTFLGQAILLEASLSFLGLGISPPTPDWGLMVSEGVNQIYAAPWLVLLPAVFISTLVVGLNFASDGLANALGLDAASGLHGA